MARYFEKTKEFFGEALNRPKPLRINSEAPDFIARATTTEKFHFHSYIDDHWVVLFSHPCDHTPVCTTEIAAFADRQDDFERRQTRLVGLSVGTVDNHLEWLANMTTTEDPVTTRRIEFPIIADEKGEVAKLYDMLDREECPTNEEVTACSPKLHTIRSVFIINKKKQIRAILSYPMETGRNIDEIIRIIDSMQARAEYGNHIVTPVNWKPGDDVLIRQTDKQAEGRRSDTDFRHFLPYMKFRPLPRDKLLGFRLDTKRPIFPELGTTSPIAQHNTTFAGPSTSGRGQKRRR